MDSVCFNRFHSFQILKFSKQDEQFTNLPAATQICFPHQSNTSIHIEMPFANVTTIPSAAFHWSTFASTVTGPALKNALNTLLILLQLVITIPVRVFLYALVQLQQIFFDLFIKKKVEAFLTVILIFLALTLFRRHLTYWRKRNIPFESFTAHLCHFRPFSRLIPFSDVNRVRRLGRIFGSYKITRPVLCIADCKVIEQILYSQSDYFTGQNTWQIEGHLLSESTFANSKSDIQRWKRKKTILMSSFLSRKLKLLKPNMDCLTEQLFTYIQTQIDQNQKGSSSWKMENLVSPWLIYSLLALIFDIELPNYTEFVHESATKPDLIVSCGCMIKGDNRMHDSVLLCLLPSLNRLVNLHLFEESNLKRMQCVLDDAIQYRLDNGLLGLSDCDKRPSKKSVKFRDEVLKNSSELIEAGKTDVVNVDTHEQLSGNQQRGRPHSPRVQLKELTFIDIILNYEIEPEDKLEGYELSRQELLDNLTAFFTVSLATLSQAISASLLYLALYNEEQDKVYQEVADCIGLRSHINWESLRNLKYMEAFIKEVLRLNPPIERIERECTKSCHLESDAREYSLSPGMLCTILVSAVHRDPEYYSEPNQFKPDRFLNHEQTSEKSNIDSGNSKFFAFGLGSRTCIGLKFVMFYLKHLLANVVLEYKFNIAPQSTTQYMRNNIDARQVFASQIEIEARRSRGANRGSTNTK